LLGSLELVTGFERHSAEFFAIRESFLFDRLP
jgi:hypothetical protein